METKRTFLAIALAFLILVGWQYFFVPPVETPVPEQSATENSQQESAAILPVEAGASLVQDETVPAPEAGAPQGRDITIETSLYTAVITESGGGVKSFKLKNYNEALDPESGLKELIKTQAVRELPLFFTWGIEPTRAVVPTFTADREHVSTSFGGTSTLTLTAPLASGLELTRILTFSDQDYKIDMAVEVRNTTQQSYQGAPFLSLVNNPFSVNSKSDRFLFNGPAVYLENVLEETKVDDIIEDGPKTMSGRISWVAYESTYFMCGIIPENPAGNSVTLSSLGDTKVSTVISAPVDILASGESKTYQYGIYFGPKKLSILKTTSPDLHRIVNFGWFDVMAKPALYLLNFFYKYVGNYGLAIILVTVLIKGLFWPISHKGMKSMKTMQKLQPKMTKLREKYKDDKERLNKEMIELYKTYKVNPLGGCLPMVLQIPVFFALYKVLLQTIELRHAPFMLWITDLSAPDRLFIGFDLPFLGGLPVLTLLMGASMFMQQKMTPNTAANPEMARVMMFMPVVFTFLFLNFASGLVLYWFVNNLLSMAQQYVINRQVD
ncbi:MAG: membrane protein insertase YidC [Proteobacteria bacterium]|nr:membrane protein insertase YidC [Pseudomonadota bacterium]MBU1708601.1 membrane protein insertase YidC [Pseudomonadota bacterium]